MPDEPPRHRRIDIVCPDCGHVQSEPTLVISTQCRACRANFQVHDGKAVVRARPVARLAKPKIETESTQETPPEKSAAGFLPRKPAPPLRSFWRRLLLPDKPPREVTCFSCQHLFKASSEAQSSQCPRCGGYVSLRDYEITEPWNRRIQTCGDVIIRKTGSVTGTTTQCHHLTVLGELAGSVECTGDLTIRSHGKIIGTVHCRTLRVERGAHVEFLNPVIAQDAFIAGNVRGQLTCSGTITLAKKAHLQGLARATSLIIKPGAKHTGIIEMIGSAKVDG